MNDPHLKIVPGDIVTANDDFHMRKQTVEYDRFNYEEGPDITCKTILLVIAMIKLTNGKTRFHPMYDAFCLSPTGLGWIYSDLLVKQ